MIYLSLAHIRNEVLSKRGLTAKGVKILVRDKSGQPYLRMARLELKVFKNYECDMAILSFLELKVLNFRIIEKEKYRTRTYQAKCKQLLFVEII